MDEQHLIELENRFIQLKNQGKNLDEITALLQIERSLVEEWNGYFVDTEAKIKEYYKELPIKIRRRNENSEEGRYKIGFTANVSTLEGIKFDLNLIARSNTKEIPDNLRYIIDDAKKHLEVIEKYVDEINLKYFDTFQKTDIEFNFQINIKNDEIKNQVTEALDFWMKYCEAPKILQFFSFKPIQINYLKINNVRVFNYIDLIFNNENSLNLFIGANSRGKSTILQLIALGLNNIKRPPLSYNWEKVVRLGNEKGLFEIGITTQENDYTLKFEINQDDEVVCVEGKEQLDFISKNCLILGYGVNRTIIRSPINPAKDFEPIATLFRVNGYLKNIQDSSTYQFVQLNFFKIKDLINLIFEEAKLQTSIEQFDTSTFYFRTPTNLNALIPLESISEGFKATFVWLFDMLIRIVERGGNIDNTQFITGIVMIDEIDLHLHPTWQRTILPSLQKVFPNIQFIVTTHSPIVLLDREADEIIELYEEDGEVKARNGEGTKNADVALTLLKYFDLDSVVSPSLQEKINRYNQLYTEKGETDETRQIAQELKNNYVDSPVTDYRYLKFLELMKKKGLLKTQTKEEVEQWDFTEEEWAEMEKEISKK